MQAGPSGIKEADELEAAVEALMEELAALPPEQQERIAKQIEIIRKKTGLRLPDLEDRLRGHFPYLPVW